MASHDATDSPVGASRGLILTLRGRAGLSQRELSALLGVSERAIQAWEAGLSYPSAASLQRLIALHLERGTSYRRANGHQPDSYVHTKSWRGPAATACRVYTSRGWRRLGWR